MSLESKAEILDIYTEQREQIYEDDIDNCNNWDEKTLKDVVEANAKKYNRQIQPNLNKNFLSQLKANRYRV